VVLFLVMDPLGDIPFYLADPGREGLGLKIAGAQLAIGNAKKYKGSRAT